MDRTIYGFIFRHSKKQQIFLLLLTLAAFPFLYVSLELPKTIINKAINGRDFPKEILGVELDQIPYLLVLCFAFLLLVLVNGGFKYVINTWKGRLGERMLRRLRYELYSRVLRFPLPHFKRVSQGEIIPMITAEVEPIGGFIGDAVAQPLFQAGQLLTIFLFIIIQDPVLGLAAIALYPFQGYVIPKLQRRVNLLGKERIRTVRRLSDRVGESISGIAEIRAHDAARYQRAGFAELLGTIYDIRFEIYQRKFFIKFLNNFINQLTPFFFYSIGGYLVITGDLSFGALVAVLAAFKEMSAPWKELLLFYQQKEDAKIKYEQVIEQFEPAGLLDDALQRDDGRPAAPFPADGEVAFANVTYNEDGGRNLVENVSVGFRLNQHVAVLGGAGSGKDEIAMLLARLLLPTAGRITIAGQDLAQLPEAVVGRRISYVGPNAYLFAASIRENLMFGLKHRPGGGSDAQRARWLLEAELAGNDPDDVLADWIDYESAGAAAPEELGRRMLEVLALVDMEHDLYQLGLRGTIDPRARRELAEGILAARRALRERAADPAVAQLIEPFDAERYNRNATLAENLLFGTPVGPAFDIDNLSANPYVLRVLDAAGLTERLIGVGRDVAELMVELFGDVAPGQELFELYSFIKAEDLPEFQAILARSGRGGVDALRPEDRIRLLSLPFRLIPARHRLDAIDEDLQQRVLEARRIFVRDLPQDLRREIEFFDAERYNAAGTIQDNILFGKIAYGHAGAAGKVAGLVGEIVEAVGIRTEVTTVGLDHQVGIGGARLGAAQRQKLAIARALLKRPDMLVLNEATAALDAAGRMRVLDAVLQEAAGRCVVCTLEAATQAARFDRVVVLRNGQVVEQGSYGELQEGGAFRELVAAE